MLLINIKLINFKNKIKINNKCIIINKNNKNSKDVYKILHPKVQTQHMLSICMFLACRVNIQHLNQLTLIQMQRIIIKWMNCMENSTIQKYMIKLNIMINKDKINKITLNFNKLINKHNKNLNIHIMDINKNLLIIINIIILNKI